jgi:hypothetical protein
VPGRVGPGRFFAGQLGEGVAPAPAELARYVAECQVLRMMAVKHHLDPETALPEDLLVLEEDKDGKPLVFTELERCSRWAGFEAGRRRAP